MSTNTNIMNNRDGNTPERPLNPTAVKLLDLAEYAPWRILFCLVTPEIARLWLDLVEFDRRVIKLRVEQYSAYITKGEWKGIIASVMFDANGKRVNGKHTLMSIVKTGIPCVVGVRTGISCDAVKYIDGGKERDIAARVHFDLDGREATREYSQTQTGRICKLITGMRRAASGFKQTLVQTEVSDVVSELEQNEALRWVADRYLLGKNMPRVGFMLALIEFRQKDPDAAEMYAEDFFSGKLEYSQTRRMWAWMKDNAHRAGLGTSQQAETYGKTITTMKAFVAGMEVKTLTSSKW